MAIRRGVGLVFALIVLAVVVSMGAMVVAYYMAAREPAIARNSTLVLRVSGDLGEMEPGGVIGQLLPSAPTVRGIVETLRKAKVDERVSSVIVAPSSAGMLWGKVQEVREAVLDFKRSGKPVIGYLEYGGEQEYYLASACDRVYLMPASPLDLTGIASYELFLRGTLDKIGAYPDLLHIGEYKTASNTFTEKTYTPAHKEMAVSLNADLYTQLVRGIADGRRKSERDVRALIDQGPFLPEEAVRVGLVDDVAYEDQLDDKVKLGARGVRRLDLDDYQRVSAASLGLNRGPRIAVIYAVGVINTGPSRYDSPGGQVAGSETIVEYIRKARADRSIKAIVVRVDSPGGSAIASDVIWRELRLTLREKPVIASMGDVAASGGYYVAMPAHVVVAQPATLTGSIGVVTGKFVTGGTWQKLGANIESVSQGRFAELSSPVRPYSDEERAKVEELMQAIYDMFVEKAAESRHTTPERIDSVAQGRVWTGAQAKRVGLVDELGGLQRAVAIAKERAKIAADAEVELVIYPPRRSFYEMLSDPFGEAAASAATLSLLGPEERRTLARLTAPLRLFRRGEPLALMPNIFLR